LSGPRAQRGAWRWARIGLLLGLFAATPAPIRAAATEAGERIYREGLLPSGQPLRATVGSDVELRGTSAACVNCHRRSGYGGIEGDSVVPPITAGALFGDRPDWSRRAFYDHAALKRALREGLHLSGRPLRAPMPRYVLADADLERLIGYLKTLSAAPSPGVTDREIHFATFVTDGVPAHQRRALLEVFNAFVRQRNAALRAPRDTDPRRILGHGRAYRSSHAWRLHVWDLQGAPVSWPAQVDRYLHAQRVYAVLGGVGRGDWRELHAHCERLELPCLFPNTEIAAPSERDFFSLYFTRGVLQEAEVLAETLLDQPRTGPRRIVQVYRAGDSGAQAARALRRALAAASEFEIHDRLLTDADTGRAGFWREVFSPDPEAVVLWLRDADLASLPGRPGSGAALYVSDGLLADPQRALPAALRTRTSVLSLREPLAARRDRRRRLAAWLESQRLALTDERIQGNSLVTLTLAARAIDHMRGHLSRAYLVERIEHLARTGSWSSIYPQLSLGPGQRVASRGGYRMPLAADGTPAASGEWIVPGFPGPR
jgi:hypothetical protein